MFLILMKFSFSVLLTWITLKVLYLKSHCQAQVRLDLTPILSSKSFIVLHFILRSMIHLGLIFVIRSISRPFSLTCGRLGPVSICGKDYPFSTVLPILICPGYLTTFMWVCVWALFHQSVSLFFCPHHTLSMTVDLQWILKSGSARPPTLFFSFHIVLIVLGLLLLHIDLRVSSLAYTNNWLGFWSGLCWI